MIKISYEYSGQAFRDTVPPDDKLKKKRVSSNFFFQNIVAGDGIHKLEDYEVGGLSRFET